MLPQKHVLFEWRDFFSSGLLFLVGWLSTLASRGDRMQTKEDLTHDLVKGH